MKVLLISLLVFMSTCSVQAEKTRDIQILTTELAPTASWAAVSITVWFELKHDSADHSKTETQITSFVAGTGFVIDKQGDFITAAHVLDLNALTSNKNITNVRATATIRQKSGDGWGAWFDVIEKDEDHDLALCRIKGFRVYSLSDSPSAKMARRQREIAQKEHKLSEYRDFTHPFASLAISQDSPQVGRFVLVSGFPLGSWTPTIQFGFVSATEMVSQNPALATLPGKDHRQYLQISVSANHGNSGGPVIDLFTGKVVGVILDIVPAPLQVNGAQILDPGTFAASGLMLAAPASWVNELLNRHKVVSVANHFGPLVIN